MRISGQIAKIEGFIGGAKQWGQRHTYDSLGRLSVAGEYRGDNNQVSWRTHYGYDRFGNRYQNTSQTQNTGLAYVTVANADINRTTNRFASGITYDDGGNITNDNKFKANVSYAYDANNRVVSTNGGASTAVYDATGQRVCSTQASVTTTSVYDGKGQLIAEYNGTSLIREYISSVATVEGSTVRYLMSDYLGSNRVVMNDTGGVVARHDYLPFGEELAATTGMRTSAQGYGAGDPTRTKFAGMERENGLDHTLYRKAETKSGRWNSPDPYGGSVRLNNPQSFNRYHYVQNDPLNAIDPDGLELVPVTITGESCTEIGGYDDNNKWVSGGKVCVKYNYTLFVDITPSGKLIGYMDIKPGGGTQTYYPNGPTGGRPTIGPRVPETRAQKLKNCLAAAESQYQSDKNALTPQANKAFLDKQFDYDTDDYLAFGAGAGIDIYRNRGLGIKNAGKFSGKATGLAVAIDLTAKTLVGISRFNQVIEPAKQNYEKQKSDCQKQFG